MDAVSGQKGPLMQTQPEKSEASSKLINLKVRTSKNILEHFDRQKIAESLMRETGVRQKVADDIALEIEEEMANLKLKCVTAPLIREMVNVKLLEHGYESVRMKYTRLGMPVYDIKQLIAQGPEEDIQHNPETVHKIIADITAKEFAFVDVLPSFRVDDHMRGVYHIHNLNYFATRPFSFAHDLRFFLSHGLKVDGSGKYAAVTGPAKNPEVALMHAARVLSASQINCGGGQGYFSFNTLLAPYARGLDARRIKQLAEIFIYEMAQLYVARGGQTVFSSIDLDLTLPGKLKHLPAVAHGGRFNGTYLDYGLEAKMLLSGLLDVFVGGDYEKKQFVVPKINISIEKNTFNNLDGNWEKILRLTAKYAFPHFIVKQPYFSEFSTFQHCSYLVPLDKLSTQADVLNGNIRGGVLQAVTLNLPKVAYDSRGREERIYELLQQRIEFAKEVLFLKKNIIAKNLENGMLPFMEQPINHSKYLEVDRQFLILGVLGMNEFVKSITGKPMHESQDGQRLALDVVKFISKQLEEHRKSSGLNFALSGVPSKEVSMRLAEIDLQNHKNAIPQYDKAGKPYYTRGFSIEKDAPLDALERAKIESKFHEYADGGALSVLPLKDMDLQSLFQLIQDISKTKIQYFKFERA